MIRPTLHVPLVSSGSARWPWTILALAVLATPAAAREPFQDEGLEARLAEIEQLSAQARQDLAALALDESGALSSVILGVGGVAQYKNEGDADWKIASMDAVLEPGAAVRTASGAWVGVRVGVNATMYVDQITQVTLTQVEKDDDRLATRVSVDRGLIEIKVDFLEQGEEGGWSVLQRTEEDEPKDEEGPRGLALTNDFSVDLPSATMAVRGTGFGVRYGGFSGTEVFAARLNRIRAIELQYALTQFRYYMSGAAISSDQHNNPAVASLVKTLGPPALTEDDLPYFDPIYPERLPEIVSETPEPIEFCDDFPGFRCSAVASVICTVSADLFSCFGDSLSLKLGTGAGSLNRFNNRLTRLRDRVNDNFCADDPVTDDTYRKIIEAVNNFCTAQYSGNQNKINRCNKIFLQEVASFLPRN